MSKKVIIGALAHMAAGRIGAEWLARTAQEGSYWEFSDKHYEETKEAQSVSKGAYHVLMELMACVAGVPITTGAIIQLKKEKNM